MHKTIATMLSLSLLVPVAACRRERAPMTPTPPEWLDTAVTDQVRASAPEAQAIGGIFKGTAFREGDHSQWQVTLEAGQCYWFSGAGDQTVEELYLNLW